MNNLICRNLELLYFVFIVYLSFSINKINKSDRIVSISQNKNILIKYCTVRYMFECLLTSTFLCELPEINLFQLKTALNRCLMEILVRNMI